MDVFEKCADVGPVQHLIDAGFHAYYRELDSGPRAEVLQGGRRMIMLGSNNYLGLASHPRVKREDTDGRPSVCSPAAPAASATAGPARASAWASLGGHAAQGDPTPATATAAAALARRAPGALARRVALPSCLGEAPDALARCPLCSRSPRVSNGSKGATHVVPLPDTAVCR